ncbi:hypothetical protein [Glutamicibacter halophytocola]|uniref:Uncharacterized protein n=1 Tax=Glutamicibacter halophytocola TaxID=1933880 RepID=A0AA94XTG4_9MICC|nr:hypothetical protein [Glutamicibacter halophytocola]UUX60156.1 hypothetical protein NUH22_05970 [Glutamicibacter halophytocola]
MTDQDQLNRPALAAAAKGIFDVRDGEFDLDEWEDLDATQQERYECDARAAASAYIAVDRPVVKSEEELDALPQGTVIMATGGRWDPEHPELFLKCGFKWAPWMALDPSDRNDGENTESSGAVLKWRCDGEARVLYRPEVGE